MICRKCGTQNLENAQFCEKCGNKLDKAEPIPDSGEGKKPSGVIIVLGYIFAFLGGLIGIAIGAYLFTRKNTNAKFHGRNMLIIATLIMIVSIAASALIVNDLTTSLDTINDGNKATSSEGLKVLNATYNRDSQGNVLVTGEVQNSDSNPKKYVQIIANGYDANDNVVATTTTYVVLESIPAGGTSTFNCILEDPNNKIVRFTVQAKV